ncbi:hypothetical protein ACFE04_017222 [Oxalis oulophora]
MVSSHSNNSTHSEAAKMEQIITEFYAKSLHIILEARTPYMSSRNFSGEHILSSPSSSSSSSSSVRPRDKWFNLALRECPAALENLDLWRQTNLEPMVVDVLVVQRPIGWDNVNFSPRRELVRTFSSKSDQEEFGSESRNEMVIERWVLQYESKKKPNASLSSGTRRSNNLSTLYKKSILMLRTLYSTVRLLPAYKIFRDLNSSGQICPFTLTHKVSSFVEPFTRKEESEMQRFLFTPVETSGGRLSLSVVYRSLVSDLRSQQSTPISPRFIQDYVGSPLAEPLKRLPSLPLSHGSPSSLQFSRRHSWSFDPYKASPPSFPPSPAFSEPRRYPLPRHPQENSYKQNTSFEEYSPSPMFSPSPPIHIPASSLLKTHSRSESAPVRIPITKLADSPVSNKHNLPPSPPLKITRAGTFMNEKSLYRGTTVEKFSFGKDDVRKFSGVRTSSNSSPQISFSRSSSPSFQDDFDDHEFPCPFDVEDDDIIVPGSRPESFDQKGHGCEQQPDSGGLFTVRKSQDAAVGALVRTLKRAQPLCQDFSVTSKPETWENSIQERNIIPGGSHAGCSSITSSGLVISKTTADAFEELRSYKEMKDLLHSQGGRSYSYSIAAGASTTG